MIIDAEAGFAKNEPCNNLQVTFNQKAKLALSQNSKNIPDLALFIEQVLAQDPRPAYKRGKDDEKVYGMKLYDLNIQWHMLDPNVIEVVAITSMT